MASAIAWRASWQQRPTPRGRPRRRGIGVLAPSPAPKPPFGGGAPRRRPPSATARRTTLVAAAMAGFPETPPPRSPVVRLRSCATVQLYNCTVAPRCVAWRITGGPVTSSETCRTLSASFACPAAPRRPLANTARASSSPCGSARALPPSAGRCSSRRGADSGRSASPAPGQPAPCRVFAPQRGAVLAATEGADLSACG